VHGIPEIIAHDQNGWLVPPGDERLLTEAIVQLGRQRELRARLAEQGKRHVAQYFSVDRYIAELQTFYHASRRLQVTRSGPIVARDAVAANTDGQRVLWSDKV
jgi:glycosyltransferase involved in cell wall biosynthesis